MTQVASHQSLSIGCDEHLCKRQIIKVLKPIWKQDAGLNFTPGQFNIRNHCLGARRLNTQFGSRQHIFIFTQNPVIVRDLKTIFKDQVNDHRRLACCAH